MQVIVALLLLLCAVSYISEPSHYERKLERSLRLLFPNAKDIKVSIKGHGSLATLRGNLETVELTIHGAKVDSKSLFKFMGISQAKTAHVGLIGRIAINLNSCEVDEIPISKLYVELNNARYDLGTLVSGHQFLVVSVGDGKFSMSIPKSFICSRLESELCSNGFSQPKVKFADELISIEATYHFVWLRIPLKIDGELQLLPQFKISFKPRHVVLLHIVPLPRSFIERLIGTIEINLTAVETPFEVKLTSLRTTSDAVELCGIIRLPQQKTTQATQ
ncbi:MAG: hypothetical protein RUDDFDWM_001208 [Candidatus Fervidibacterota bacterium]